MRRNNNIGRSGYTCAALAGGVQCAYLHMNKHMRILTNELTQSGIIMIILQAVRALASLYWPIRRLWSG